MRWRRILIALAFAAAIAAVVFALIPREPKYEGRTLSEWIREANPRHSARYDQRKDFEAVRSIGTNALPWLVKWIALKDPPVWRLRLIAASQRLPQWIQAKLTRPILGRSSNDNYRQLALDGFVILGPQATSATVDLLQISSSCSNQLVVAEVAEALDRIGKVAFVPTLNVLTNRANSYPLRFAAAQWLFHQSVAKDSVVSFLAESIRENRTDIPPIAPYILADYQAEPDLVVPLLIKYLKDPNPNIRAFTIRSLRGYGPNASAAVPALINALNDSHPLVQEAAESALFHIDPKALDKASPARPDDGTNNFAPQ